MWEDNNPLSYDRRSSFTGDVSDIYSNPAVVSGFSSGTDYLDNAHGQASDEHQPLSTQEHNEDEDDDDEIYQTRARTGYTSRVEQNLIENKDLGILITDAGKNHEGGSGGYIVYTIRTGVWRPEAQVRGHKC